jgi:hypothetical protein
MIASATDVENSEAGLFTYKSGSLDAKEVRVRWLSKAGLDSQGGPAYGLLLFTVVCGGEIPRRG